MCYTMFRTGFSMFTVEHSVIQTYGLEMNSEMLKLRKQYPQIWSTGMLKEYQHPKSHLWPSEVQEWLSLKINSQEDTGWTAHPDSSWTLSQASVCSLGLFICPKKHLHLLQNCRQPVILLSSLEMIFKLQPSISSLCFILCHHSCRTTHHTIFICLLFC